MSDSFAAHLIGQQRNRPLSLLAVSSALILPGFLLLFLAHPSLVEAASVPALLLLSVAPSVPIVLLCFALWYTFAKSVERIQQIQAGPPQTGERPFAEVLTEEDPFEWPCFLAGGYSANLVLYTLVAIAYLTPISLGRTLLLTAAVLFGLWFVEFLLLVVVAYKVTQLKGRP